MSVDLAYLESRGEAYLFDRNEVARIIGCSTRTVIRYAERDLLTEYRVLSGRGTRSYPRYLRSSIEAFLDSGYFRPRSQRRT